MEFSSRYMTAEIYILPMGFHIELVGNTTVFFNSNNNIPYSTDYEAIRFFSNHAPYTPSNLQNAIIDQDSNNDLPYIYEIHM